jgi:hypothetical protein
MTLQKSAALCECLHRQSTQWDAKHTAKQRGCEDQDVPRIQKPQALMGSGVSHVPRLHYARKDLDVGQPSTQRTKSKAVSSVRPGCPMLQNNEGAMHRTKWSTMCTHAEPQAACKEYSTPPRMTVNTCSPAKQAGKTETFSCKSAAITATLYKTLSSLRKHQGLDHCEPSQLFLDTPARQPASSTQET